MIPVGVIMSGGRKVVSTQEAIRTVLSLASVMVEISRLQMLYVIELQVHFVLNVVPGKVL